MRVLRRIGLSVGVSVGVLVAAIAVALAWLLTTTPGAQWTIARAAGALGGKLAVRDVRGTLAGPLEVRGLRYVDPQGGIDVRVERASIDIELRALLSRRVHVRHLTASDSLVTLGEPSRPPPEKEPRGFSLEPPIDVLLDRLTIERATIRRRGEPEALLVADRAELAGAWTRAGIALRRLELRSPQGMISFAGELAERDVLVGQAAGRFRWQAGTTRYAGTLQAHGGERAVLALRLSAPMTARLDVALRQREGLPWSFELQVPRFDPRRRLAPDSSIAVLAASISGRGDRQRAQLTGRLTIDERAIEIEPLRVSWRGERVAIETLTARLDDNPGTLGLSGEVRLDRDPAKADLLLQWRDLLLPAEWAGQRLATRGALTLQGSPDAFAVRGELAAGPPGDMADVAVALTGSRKALAIERLQIAQRAGSLSARGHLRLEPVIGWQLSAEARRFDPGVFLPKWPGRLDFSLATRGRLHEAGPSASLRLTQLRGRLRERALTGEADLTLDPQRVLAGTLSLQSGRSVISVEGKSGEALDVTADFEIASLDDWLPDARGRLNGRLHVQGRWPELNVQAEAHGRDLLQGEMRARRVDLRVDGAGQVTDPRGSLSLTGAGIAAAGFEFSTLSLQVEGSQPAHTVELDGTGRPLSVRLRLQGEKTGTGWNGELRELLLAPQNAPRVVLAAPARIALAGSTFSISESCLTGADARLCVVAEGGPDGALQASYRLEHLPIALLSSLAAPKLPYSLDGTLEGQGNIRRDADGAVRGQAVIESAGGGVTQPQDETEALMRYERLRIEAQFGGDTARITASTLVAKDGDLRANVAIAGLQSGEPPSLDGAIDATLPDVAPVAVLAPQLAAVHGRIEAHAKIGGTTAEPSIAGSVRTSGLTAEIPEIGIQLRDGNFAGTLQPDGSVKLEGRISSGEGFVTVRGDGTALDALQVRIEGRQFLAANIPGARVIVDPDLGFTRSTKQMLLEGTVRVPAGRIDLSKLPQGQQGARASPDVVVVDAEQPAESDEELPLIAKITLVLGRDVELVGFGLDAKVEGNLIVMERPGEETRASGEIRLSGTYKAYGQDLTIERGRLLYAGTPLNDPQLDISAVREVGDVTARLEVSGTAQNPLLTVSSDPPMSQTEALAYLVTGRPLSQLGQGSGEDTDLVRSAAMRLGGAAGNLIAKSLGKRLGIDELKVAEEESLGGAALTVGEYLSPRLYVSYGFGLFQPGQVVTLRYLISDKLSVEASQSPKETRAGIEYRIER